MIGTAGRKAGERWRGGLRGLRGRVRSPGKQGIPVPAPVRRRMGAGPVALLAAALGIAALVIFYLRKRRQVTEHYTMGEDWEAEAAGMGGARSSGA